MSSTVIFFILRGIKKMCAFTPGCEHLYRRLTVREAARVQSFPDSYELLYRDSNLGYKMIGNAVPPKLAFHLVRRIISALCGDATCQFA
ncbi:MAG: DNA cytosine methyltransferase [Marinilabiliaceae bacterium]